MKRIFSILFAVVLALSFSLIPAALAGASPGPGLAGLWHFDEGTGTTAYDSTTNNNDGTLRPTGSEPTWVSGKFGNALSFDGTDDGVYVADSSSLDFSTAITIEAWIYLHSYTISDHLAQAVAEKALAYYLNIQAGKLSFYWYGLSVPGYHQSPNTLPLNTWIHVAATYDGSFVKLYENGVNVYSASVTGTGNTSNWPLGIGYEPFYPGRYFPGIIDEVRIWDVAMTPGPVTVPLCAGKNTNVGTVTVWNDGTNLYVKYQTTGGWEMTETHLAVATEESGIPQNRAGNPKVGQFQHSTSHATPVTTHTYTIALGDLSVEPCEDVCIATHAKVVDAGNPMTMTVVSDTDTLVSYGNFSTPHNAVYAWEPGPLYPIDGPDDSGWEQNSLWDGAIDHTFSASTDWIWESYRVVNTVAGDVVDFEKAFSIPGNPTASTLHITCDNGYEVDVNGTIVGSAQVHGEWRTSDLTESFVNSQGWQSVESWDISGLLVPGQNTLEIDTANEQLNDGTISSNPAGLIFEAEITYLLQETAWGDGTRFVDRGNWATYFEYHVQ